jgi:hypothetical protein
MESTILQDVIIYSVVEDYGRSFVGLLCSPEVGCGIFVQNIGKLPLDHTVLHTRRRYPSIGL